MLRTIAHRAAALAIALPLTLLSPSTHAAGLTLTGAGAGFTLSTAIGGYAYNTSNPVDYQFVSIGVNNAGKLIGHFGGDAYIFNDLDNQTIFSALSSASITGSASTVSLAMASAGGTLYGSLSGSSYYVLNQNGTIASTLALTPPINSLFGMWTNPANGHLISSVSGGLIDIDPIAGTYTTVFSTGDQLDGVTVSPDGNYAYVADTTTSQVLGYDVLGAGYGTNTFSSSILGSGPDGMGVLAGTCRQAGNIVVNNNNGTIGLIDPSVNNSGQTVIANGGNRGDYASLDTNNGTLLLSQNDQIARLQAPAGCSIGTVLTDAPEPASLALLATALLALATLMARRRTTARA